MTRRPNHYETLMQKHDLRHRESLAVIYDALVAGTERIQAAIERWEATKREWERGF